MPKTVIDEAKKVLLLERLQKSVLASVPEGDLERLSTSCKIMVYARGDAIIREGAYDDRIFCLIAGRAEVWKNREHRIAVLENPGEIFGELGVIDGGARSASVKAVSANTICLSIDAANLHGDDLCQRIPGFLDRIFTHLLADRLRSAVRH